MTFIRKKVTVARMNNVKIPTPIRFTTYLNIEILLPYIKTVDSIMAVTTESRVFITTDCFPSQSETENIRSI